MFGRAMRAIVETAGHDTAALIDSLSDSEFLRPRRTRAAVRREIQPLAYTATHTPPARRAELAQTDRADWIAIGARRRQDGAQADDALWFAAGLRVPATLMWLADDRRRHPALCEFRPRN